MGNPESLLSMAYKEDLADKAIKVHLDCLDFLVKKATKEKQGCELKDSKVYQDSLVLLALPD